MQEFKITNSSYATWDKQRYEDVKPLFEAGARGDEIWYKFVEGARTGSIAKVVDPASVFHSSSYGLGLGKSFSVLLGNGKEQKVGVKNYHNKLHFLLGYDGGHVDFFQKGQAKARPTETSKPDLLGNTIKVGDWVIYSPKGRYGTPGLGKLNRLSDAGNAWVMAPDRHGNEIEHMTDGASSLIKVNMTPELHSTVMLCDSLKAVRTKLVIDLDDSAY